MKFARYKTDIPKTIGGYCYLNSKKLSIGLALLLSSELWTATEKSKNKVFKLFAIDFTYFPKDSSREYLRNARLLTLIILGLNAKILFNTFKTNSDQQSNTEML